MLRARLAPLVPAVALLALTACTPAPSTAAEVGGVTITEATLTETVEGCAELGATGTRGALLTPLVIGEAARQVAAAEGVDLGSVEQAMAGDPNLTPYLANEGCTRVGEAQAILGMLYSELGQEPVIDAIVNADIVVNPRYGAWDESLGAIGGSGSISVPAGAGN